MLKEFIQQVILKKYEQRQRLNIEQTKLLANMLAKTEEEYRTKCNDNLDLISENNNLKLKLKTQTIELENYKNSDNTITNLKNEVQNKQDKLDDLKNKYSAIQTELNELNRIKKLELHQKDIEIAKITARWERALEAKDYYRELSENYQAMPNLKKLIENIVDYKVPDIEKFVDNITKIRDITNPIYESVEKVEKLIYGINDKADDITRAANYIADSAGYRKEWLGTPVRSHDLNR